MDLDSDLELFAGVPVADFPAALAWYERLLGAPPAFFPHDAEAVWALAAHRWLYVERRPDHAGHAMLAVLVADLDARVAAIAARGLEPAAWEDYGNGARKAVYRDPDGNEVGFGAAVP